MSKFKIGQKYRMKKETRKGSLNWSFIIDKITNHKVYFTFSDDNETKQLWFTYFEFADWCKTYYKLDNSSIIREKLGIK